MTNCIQCRSVIKFDPNHEGPTDEVFCSFSCENLFYEDQGPTDEQIEVEIMANIKESNPGLKGLGLRLAYFSRIDGGAPDGFFFNKRERQDVIQSDGTLEKELDDNIPF